MAGCPGWVALRCSPATVSVLRPFRRDDADDVVAGCNDPLTQRFLPLLPRPYTAADAAWWINEGAPAAFAAGGGAYADRRPGDRPGHRRRRATTTCATAPARSATGSRRWARGRGVATAPAGRWRRTPSPTASQRLALRTEPENTASQRVAIAAGFAREGVERGGGRSRDGGRHDLIVWARLDTDTGEPVPPPAARPARAATAADRGSSPTAWSPCGRCGREDAADTHAAPQPARGRGHLRAAERARPDRRRARAAPTREAGWLAGERADFTIRDAATGAYAGEIGLYYWGRRRQRR